MDDIDIDRYLENGTVTIDQVTVYMVAGLAKQHHATIDEMADELIRDGIEARATRRIDKHKCVRGEINKRHCRICSRSMGDP